MKTTYSVYWDTTITNNVCSFQKLYIFIISLPHLDKNTFFCIGNTGRRHYKTKEFRRWTNNFYWFQNLHIVIFALLSLGSSLSFATESLEEEVAKLKNIVAELSRQSLLAQLHIEEKTRNDGDSGIKQVGSFEMSISVVGWIKRWNIVRIVCMQ